MIKNNISFLAIPFLMRIGFPAIAVGAAEVVQNPSDLDMRVLTRADASIIDKEHAIKAFNLHVGHDERKILASAAVKDPDWQIRKSALQKLWEMSLGDKDNSTLLFDTAIKATRDSEGLVRSTACVILRHRTNDTDVVALVETLRHEFELERDERGAKTDLRLRLEKTWWRDSVVRVCIESLIHIGKSNIRALEMNSQEHPADDLGFALGYVLYKLGQTPDVEKLVAAIQKSSSEWIRLCAIQAIGEIGDKRAIPVLRTCLNSDFQIKTKERKIIYPIREAARQALDKTESKNRAWMLGDWSVLRKSYSMKSITSKYIEGSTGRVTIPIMTGFRLRSRGRWRGWRRIPIIPILIT